MQNKRRTGGCYEAAAAAYLEKQGLVILRKNYRCRSGEIDLIARDGRYLVFIEVKYRNTAVSGSASDCCDSCQTASDQQGGRVLSYSGIS